MKSVAFIFAAVVGLAGAAHAQPADPYGPGPYPQPGPYVQPGPPPVYLPAPVQPVPGPMPAGVRPWRPWRAQGAQGGELRAAIIARFDRNHDGVLEPQERRRAIRALRRIARRMAREERRTERAERRGW